MSGSKGRNVSPREEESSIDITVYRDLITRTVRWTAHALGPALHEEDVEDVVQEVLLALWQRHPTCDPRCAEAFVRRASRNATIDFLRRAFAKKRDTRATLPLTALDDLEQAAAASSLRRILAREKFRQVFERIRRVLSQRAFEAFCMRRVIGLSSHEIAQRLGSSENAVDSLLCRARRRLREAEEVDPHGVCREAKRAA